MICKLSVVKKPKCDIAAAIPVRSYVKVFCDGSYNGSFDISIESMSGSRDFEACESVRLEVVNVYSDGTDSREKVGIDLNEKMETPIPPVVAGSIWLFTLSVEPSSWESLHADVLADLNAVNESVVTASSQSPVPGSDQVIFSGPTSFFDPEQVPGSIEEQVTDLESVDSTSAEGQQSSGE